MAAVAALPTAASAELGPRPSGVQDSASIRFPGSNGYEIAVQAISGARDDPFGLLFVSAQKIAKKDLATVTYMVRGTLASDDSLEVHLPHVGRIDVTFDARKTTRRRLPKRCTGHPTIVSRGYFRGTIELHGERDFTAVERSSAPGQVTRSFRKSCRKGKSRARRSDSRAAGKKEVFTLLAAGVRQGTLNVIAMKNLIPGFDASVVSAEKTRFREGMLIATKVAVKAKADDLVAPDPGKPKIVELTPPAPFEGSATFELTSPKTSTWRGDLAVELPNLGRTRLAGKSFESVLCQGTRCTHTASGPIGFAAELAAEIFG